MKRRIAGPSAQPLRVDRRRVRWWYVVVPLLVLGVAAFFHLQPTEGRSPQRIILVSIDTLRADRLGCYGYTGGETPHIDRLARDAVVFENAATTTPLTLPAHVSMLTGLGPLRHGVIDNFGYPLGDEEATLAEILHEHGFATGGFVGAFVLDARWGLAQGFDTYFDRFDTPTGTVSALSASERRGGEVLEPALEWIRRRKDQPFFAFIHFYDPHTPYDPPEPYKSRYGSSREARYDGEVAYVDSLVGRLVSALEEEDLYRETLLVLLGDHGESLGEHGEETHGFFIYDATVRVPLLVKAPGFAPSERVRTQVRTIDVMPTVLDILGIESPRSVDGVSLRPLLRDPGAEMKLTAYMESHYARIHFGWAPLRGVREDRYKYVEAPRPELYDLVSDPAENRNLLDESPGLGKRFEATLSALEEQRPSERREPQIVDAETAQRLQALGYITASVPGDSSAQDWKVLADPKDKIDVFNRVTEATNLNRTGNVELAKSVLKSVLQEAPDVDLAYTVLGNIFLQGRQYREAESVFRNQLERIGESFNAVYGLALAYKGLRRLEDASGGFERAAELDPSRARAVFQLAEVRLAQGRPHDAERLLRDQLETRPDASLYLILADALLAQEKRREALQVLRDGTERDADNVMIQLSIGSLLMAEGDVKAAIGAFERAKEVAPREPRVFNALGNARAAMGDDAGALENFQKAIELDSTFAPAHNNLGIALARLGRSSEAERAFLTSIESDPNYAEAYNNLGFLYLQAGAADKAIPLLRRAVALKPDYTQAKANLAAAVGEVGRRP